MMKAALRSNFTPYQNSFIQAMEDAQQQIYNRLAKIADIFTDIKAEYAVVGGNAVIAWMRAKQMDSRTTRDVDIMLRKKDLSAIRSALERQGYEFIRTSGMSLFFDTTEGVERKVQNGIRLIFSGEKVKNATMPELAYTEFGGMKVATIENLLKMKVMELAHEIHHAPEQITLLSYLTEKSQDNGDLPSPKLSKLSTKPSHPSRKKPEGGTHE